MSVAYLAQQYAVVSCADAGTPAVFAKAILKAVHCDGQTAGLKESGAFGLSRLCHCVGWQEAKAGAVTGPQVLMTTVVPVNTLVVYGAITFVQLLG